MSVIDPTVISERKEEMEEAFGELVETFIEDAQSALVAIEQAVDADSALDLRQHTHALKSSSGYMGADKVVSLAAQMESAAVNGSAAQEAQNAKELRVAVDEAVAELSTQMAA